MEVNKVILEGMVLEGLFKKMVDSAKEKKENLYKNKNADARLSKNKDTYKEILSKVVPIIKAELNKIKGFNDPTNNLNVDKIVKNHIKPIDSKIVAKYTPSSGRVNVINIYMDYIFHPEEDDVDYDTFYDEKADFDNALEEAAKKLNKNSTIKKYCEVDLDPGDEYYIISITINKDLLDYSL